MEGGVMEEDNNNVMPRRSLRLALSEIVNETSPTTQSTPNKNTNPDEMLIMQRGPRRKPIIWSPVDYDRKRILGPTRDRTPEPTPPSKSELNPKLRRRLIMSPNKNPSEDIGKVIAKKLRPLRNLDKKI